MPIRPSSGHRIAQREWFPNSAALGSFGVADWTCDGRETDPDTAESEIRSVLVAQLFLMN